MRTTLRHGLWMVLFLLTTTLATASPARADGCRRVFAQIDLAEGVIIGNLGLVGSVAFTADSAGTAPATAPATSSVFSGILTITTEEGALEMRETGMFSSRRDTSAGGVLSSWADFSTGTGRYAELTSGELFFFGTNTGEGLQLDVVGELCKD